MIRWLPRAALAAIALPCLARAQTAPPPPAPMLPQVNIVGASPLLGTGIDRDLLPGESHVLDSGAITREGAPDALRALDESVGGVNLDSASGNPYQPSLFYHGFEASPLQGAPQGLAVYLNGVRFNQAFGDTVNWDLIPNQAIDRINLEGSNPVFGLNALGGALSVQLKNGFGYHGGEADVSGGSFGQITGNFQYGHQAGSQSVYVAASGIHQDGWRDLQSSDIQNFYGDVGWCGDAAEAHLNALFAHSALNGPGTAPVQLLAAAPAAQFTAPNAIDNRFGQLSLSGTADVSDSVSVQGVAYAGNFAQQVSNGNVPNDAACNDGSGLLCQSPGVPSTTRGGAPVPDFLAGGPYSVLNRETTNTTSYGASVQATDQGTVLGLHNQVLAGISFDGAQTEFDASSIIGGLAGLDRVFAGPGIVLDEPGALPVRVAVSDGYYGAFVSDTLELGPRLAVTGSGRLNLAGIDLQDQGGGQLTGNHRYERFNPALGLTYKATPWLTAYAGYAEANRAPTPAELSCASAADACSLANFFVGDPNLKQVVAHTVEAGLRGTITTLGAGAGRLSYSVGLYRTESDDDIIFVNSPVLGRGFFTNVGQTRRQGVDAGLDWTDPRWMASLQYSYTEATFQTGFVAASPNNPQADANGNIGVRPGNRLPGIPANQVKLTLSYKVTERWTVGAAAIARSGQYLFGDEANLTPQLPGYVTLNLNTSYQVTPAIQIFGLVENVTDTQYYTYGTFAPTGSVFLAQAPNATNPRSYSPAAPVGGYAGVRVTF